MTEISDTEGHGAGPNELPKYAQVEDVARYIAGGFHPIHLGDRIGPDGRFEVRHKLGYSTTCTAWLCLDNKGQRHVCVKVLRADESSRSHPEIVALGLFEGIDRQELEINRIFPIDEHFWINGPNGRHICLVVQVLGPAISYDLKGIDLDTPNSLRDLCLQASRSLKYLHDKRICHGDYRPDHMRMQLDTHAMRGSKIYDLFGEPKIWHLTNSQQNNDGRCPRYLVESGDVLDVESKYRTGVMAIDCFSASYRVGEAIELHISDTYYCPPEIRFLNTSAGFASDVWTLASTIHLIRMNKLLFARLESKSSLVSWMNWAYGPFPKAYWEAIGKYLSDDSTVPVFAVKPIPQKPVSPKWRSSRKAEVEATGYPREWGDNRREVVALLLGNEETPRSIQQRRMQQEDQDRSKYMRIKLPKNSNVWTRFQEQRKRLTGYQSLLHEDLSKERHWYQRTAAPNGDDEDTPKRSPNSIDDATLRRLNGQWDPGFMPASGRGTDAGGGPEEMGNPANPNGKRLLAEPKGAQPALKRARLFVPKHKLRDRVERVEQDDGMTKLSYRLQPKEADLLADLLRGMLMSNPDERISVDEVLRHDWFEEARQCLEE